MARKRYRNQLQDLRGNVTAMGETALERFEEAVTVLESNDAMVAERIVAGDDELNRWYLDIEQECVRLLALEQPVASDLRFVAASFKIVTDFERVGDLATNLARYGGEGDRDLEPLIEVVPLARTAGEMLGSAIQSYARRDAAAAREVAARDDALDAACADASTSVARELLTGRGAAGNGGGGEAESSGDRAGPSGATGAWAAGSGGGGAIAVDERLDAVSRTLLTIRDVERVGDHAVNVAARTLYMLERDDELIY